MLIAALMVPVLGLAHGSGLLGMSHMFNLTDEALLHRKFSARSIFLVSFVAVLLFALHAVEIAAVGLLYDLGGASPTFPRALIISASYYTTTGTSPDHLPGEWGLIGQAEALLGLLLIGWSTAFLVRKIERLQQRDQADPAAVRQRRLRGQGYGGRAEKED